MIRRFLLTVATALLLASNVSAQELPKRRSLLGRFGHEVKMSFLDIKRHPIRWGLFAGATIGINFADAATSCRLVGTPGLSEQGSSHFLIGAHPSCAQHVGLMLGVTPIQLASVHALSNKLYEHCEQEAADPNSRFNRIQAANHSPEPCHYMVQYGALAVDAPFHVQTIKRNVDLSK